jgi:hypothetical protein
MTARNDSSGEEKINSKHGETLSMLLNLLRLLILLGVLCQICLAGPRQSKHQLSVLIIDGINNHDWEAGARAVQGILTETGRFTVKISTRRPEARQKKRGTPGARSFPNTTLY